MPRLVAESLAPVRELAAATLPWPAPAGATHVAAAIASALAPEQALTGAPSWLRPEQVGTVGRVLAVLERHDGALLADPVGSGKTYVALAVAAMQRGRTAAVVPAPLVDQWRMRAAECGVALEVVSHTAVSRGVLPETDPRLVIIDEAHHFRHPGTRRYGTLARFLVARRMLALTATPLVNRPEDLLHQLLVGIHDDALRAEGTPSLRHSLTRGHVPAALGSLVVATPPSAALPGREERRVGWSLDTPVEAPPWMAELDALAIATRGSVAALVRCVLLNAAASSPAALHGALGRYAALLRHGLEARRAGRAIDRAAIRRFTAEAPEQLLLWELMPDESSGDVLPLGDLDRVEALRRSIDLSGLDHKVETLRSLLADGEPTLVFVNAVATVTYLRERLADLTPAWVTGSRAGWRHVPVPRGQVLSWFRPNSSNVAPWVLLASDVAAEGLDLQRARRVIHYDLPWTAMRLAQREGRSRRLGATHASVEVVRFEPPAWLERRLRIGAALRRKHLLGRRAGFEGDASPWRWRQDVGREWSGIAPIAGTAAVVGTQERLLLAVAIGANVRCAVIDDEGRWSEAPRTVAAFLRRAGTLPASVAGIDVQWRERAAAFIRAVVRDATDRAWRRHQLRPSARMLIARLQTLLRAALRERDHPRAAAAEHLLSFVARGHTAGEAALVDDWSLLDDGTLLREANSLPERREAALGPLSIRTLGAILETRAP